VGDCLYPKLVPVYVQIALSERGRPFRFASTHYARHLGRWLTAPAQAQTTKLNVAYTSTTTNFSMEMITHVRAPKPHNIKHPSKPWYVVSLEVPERSRKYLRPPTTLHDRSRITGKTEGGPPSAVSSARRIRHHGNRRDTGQFRRSIVPNPRPNRNWWEIECTRNLTNSGNRDFSLYYKSETPRRDYVMEYRIRNPLLQYSIPLSISHSPTEVKP
jgi:hypothetical protein